jgi:hypothetical protein
MPLYTYKNPNTGELFESISTIDNRDNPVVLEDGTKCYRVPFPPTKRGGAIINKNREVFEADPDYVKKCNLNMFNIKMDIKRDTTLRDIVNEVC